MEKWLSASKVSELLGVHPNTLRRWDKDGTVTTKRTPGNQRLYPESSLPVTEKFPRAEIIRDIGSGLNFKRKGFNSLLERVHQGRIKSTTVAHRDRLCRFGFDLFKRLYELCGTELVVLDRAVHRREGIVRLTKEQKEAVVSLYIDGKNCQEIANIFGVDRSSIYGLVVRRKCTLHSMEDVQRGYKIRSDCFDIMDEESLYWLGFLAADGNVHKTTIQVCLQERDIGHLIKMKEFFGLNKSVKAAPNKCVRIAFLSKSLTKKLASFGITERKSHTLKVRDELASRGEFWRGYFDGNGYLGISGDGKIRAQLTGSSAMMELYLVWVNSVTQTKAKVITDKSVYRVCLSCRPALQVLAELYPVDAAVYLERKFNGARGIFLRAMIDHPELKNSVLVSVS